MLDDVHRGHGQTGAIHETRNAAVQLDVIQRELAGFDFQRRFLVQITHRQDVRVAVQGVVVEGNFGVEGNNRFLAVGQFHHGEGVEFHHGGVAFPPSIINTGYQLHAGVEKVALQTQRRRDLARLIGHDAQGRINVFLENFLGMLLGDFFDVHAAFGARHDQRARIVPVQQHGQIIFFFDLGTRRQQQRLHQPAVRTGLFGDEHIAEHLFGKADGFIHGGRHFDAALEAGFKSSLAATTGVDLRLDHHLGTATGDEFFRRRPDFGKRLGGDFERNRNAIFGE